MEIGFEIHDIFHVNFHMYSQAYVHCNSIVVSFLMLMVRKLLSLSKAIEWSFDKGLKRPLCL